VNVVLGVTEIGQRRRCFELAEHHHIDILTVTKLVVETVTNEVSVDLAASDMQLNAATSNVSILLFFICSVIFVFFCIF